MTSETPDSASPKTLRVQSCTLSRNTQKPITFQCLSLSQESRRMKELVRKKSLVPIVLDSIWGKEKCSRKIGTNTKRRKIPFHKVCNLLNWLLLCFSNSEPWSHFINCFFFSFLLFCYFSALLSNAFIILCFWWELIQVNWYFEFWNHFFLSLYTH